MRSPISAQLALDGVGTMVNCTVKSEDKKEPCHEAPQGAASAAEPQPADPARTPQDGADPQAPAQVPSTFPGAPGSVSLPCLCPYLASLRAEQPHSPSWAAGAGRELHRRVGRDGQAQSEAGSQATCQSWTWAHSCAHALTDV